MSKISWTEERVSELTRLVAARTPLDEIAAHFGISRNGIQVACSRAGLRPSHLVRRSEREQIDRLTREGWRPSRIARQVRLPLHIVEMYLGSVAA